MKLTRFSKYPILFLLALTASFLLNSCGGSGGKPSPDASGIEGVFGSEVAGDPHAFRGAGIVKKSMYLIGGPLAQGRVGDILLQNDKIRVIIQKPRRNAGVALYGGNIIDADILRPAGEPGRDNFGITFPLINISWTPFYKKLEIINGDFSKGPIIVRASGILTVYDYIQTSIIVPFAKIANAAHPKLFFPGQFNDILDPFRTLPRLKAISTTVVTDYILRQDQSYVIIQTYLQNSGSQPVAMPVGDWINPSGTLETFVPKIGFTGQGLYDGNIPALILPGMETDTGVSYGYFYDPNSFKNQDGTFRPTDLLTVSGVSIMGLGEKVAPGLIPAFEPAPPKINFSLPPGRTELVRYFAVGNGDVGSVLTGGLQALGIPTARLAGKVVDINNNAVGSARVYVIDTQVKLPNGDIGKRPVAMFYSDPNGNFSGEVSTGADDKAKLFGSGKYVLEVYKEGYLFAGEKWAEGDAPHPSLAGKGKAGRRCSIPNDDLSKIECHLGDSGTVTVTSNGPARIAIVGFDPSPFHKTPKVDQGQKDDDSALADIEFQGQQYGYIDALFLDKTGEQITNTGNPRYVNKNTFRLEPGKYLIFVMRGPEYSMHMQEVDLVANPSATVTATLKKVVDTSGYISGDFHIHGINSPDSPYGLKARVNFALAEGLDIMVSADHDVITDYGPTIQELGVQDLVTSIPGDEITPMAFGHFNAFPLLHNPENPMGGAFDYTQKDGFNPGPSHHQVLSPAETLAEIDKLNPGEQVLQVNHVQDPLLGNWALSKLLTTTYFPNVPPLSTFALPVYYRLEPDSHNSRVPLPYGSSSMFYDKFTSAELCIGEDAKVTSPNLYDTALPMWFDFLNLGKIATATCSSDTHRQIREPIGGFRNYIVTSIDPRDGTGSYAQVDPQAIAHAVNQHQVVVSSGPFIRVAASKTDGSNEVSVGGTIAGTNDVKLTIHVESPDWMDWDQVDIYVNTDPTPAKDDLTAPWDSTAENFVTPLPDGFPNHITPKYCYAPLISYERKPIVHSTCADWWKNITPKTLTQTVKNGVRSAVVNETITLSQDSWIVVMVKGSSTAHSIFPYAPKAVNTQGADVQESTFLTTLTKQIKNRTTEQDPVDPTKTEDDLIGGSKAFAFTNPIFVDVDGNGWTALHKDKSPLK